MWYCIRLRVLSFTLLVGLCACGEDLDPALVGDWEADRVASAARWRANLDRQIASRDNPGPVIPGTEGLKEEMRRLSGGSDLPLEQQRDIVLSSIESSTEFWRFASDGSFAVYQSEADTNPDRGRWRVGRGRVALKSGDGEWMEWFLWRDGRLEIPFSMNVDSASSETVPYVRRR